MRCWPSRRRPPGRPSAGSPCTSRRSWSTTAGRRPGADLADRLAELIAADRRGDAVELYQLEGVGLPEELVLQLRHAPFRPGLEAIAHTLVYEAELTADLSLPDELPDGRRRTLAGQTHDINPEVTAAALAEFLSG